MNTVLAFIYLIHFAKLKGLLASRHPLIGISDLTVVKISWRTLILQNKLQFNISKIFHVTDDRQALWLFKMQISNLLDALCWHQDRCLYKHYDEDTLSLSFMFFTDFTSVLNDEPMSVVAARKVLQWQACCFFLVILLTGCLQAWHHTWKSSRWAEKRHPEKSKLQWFDAILDFSIKKTPQRTSGFITVSCPFFCHFQIHGTLSLNFFFEHSWWWQSLKTNNKGQISTFVVKYTEYQTRFSCFSIQRVVDLVVQETML